LLAPQPENAKQTAHMTHTNIHTANTKTMATRVECWLLLRWKRDAKIMLATAGLDMICARNDKGRAAFHATRPV
jgi:hypothetical protein